MSLRALVAAAALAAAAASAAGLDAIAERDAAAGLRAALEKGALAAVAALGRNDGFLGDDRVRIALPESLARYERAMRAVGLGRYADELIVAMNRAAEAAVPEAKALVVDAVKKMTVQDAKAILAGGETAGTDYFRRTTSDALRAKFLPIVQKATKKVKLAEVYNRYAERGVQFGLIAKEHANLDDYVAQKALEGLFYMVAEEEKRIRRDPAKAGSDLIRKVFGALR
ncbi:MAG: DUF4197 domain-containing protein [Burkholderiales bacterium]|nr:DUF4197 domain-containing protein [Burkholderiales bacterium]MDW8468189.1 DUF4197 domain-containing protein [Burkholderiales bacterium]